MPQSRDQVQIAGSSTVLPYASIVAEAFGENFDYPTPVVESGGSSAGLKRFCEGVGENTIDIANASRAHPVERDRGPAPRTASATSSRSASAMTASSSPADINGPDFAFSPAEWYQALAAAVPQDGELVDNPNANWTDVDA